MWNNFYITWQNHIIGTKAKGWAKSGYKPETTCKSFYMSGDITMKTKNIWIWQSWHLFVKNKNSSFLQNQFFFKYLIFNFNFFLAKLIIDYWREQLLFIFPLFIYLFFTTPIPTKHEKKGRGLGFRVLGDWRFPLTPPHSICVSVSARTLSFFLHRPVPPCPPPRHLPLLPERFVVWLTRKRISFFFGPIRLSSALHPTSSLIQF